MVVMSAHRHSSLWLHALNVKTCWTLLHSLFFLVIQPQLNSPMWTTDFVAMHLLFRCVPPLLPVGCCCFFILLGLLKNFSLNAQVSTFSFYLDLITRFLVHLLFLLFCIFSTSVYIFLNYIHSLHPRTYVLLSWLESLLAHMEYTITFLMLGTHGPIIVWKWLVQQERLTFSLCTAHMTSFCRTGMLENKHLIGKWLPALISVSL